MLQLISILGVIAFIRYGGRPGLAVGAIIITLVGFANISGSPAYHTDGTWLVSGFCWLLAIVMLAFALRRLKQE